MKPVIGICANFTADDTVGVKSGLGLPGQEWQVLADDYVKAIERAGGTPIILPITSDVEALSGILPKLDGILFSGGSDIEPKYYGEQPRYGLGDIDPYRDRHEMELANIVIHDMDIPVLGICRGSQLINVVMGGTIYQDLKLERDKGFNHTLKGAPKFHPTHPVTIKDGSKLAAIFNETEIWVNSFNHQGINKIGDKIEVTMEAPDGHVEGIEMIGDRFVVAVQWHPEMMIDKYNQYQVLFDVFVSRCNVNVLNKKEMV
ncbi:gamma-glutamyl-gamma-aminobutyrate hydrolase family protein [Fredinandcohnia salidurans]|uniref:Gamma-glutamyl-gamma-aminobutyrate hydrolase family protein n=1 Tax=Fredinandcohnia salidurans TaxID=2595041 RepID=A0ABW4MUK6_9BACI